MRTLLRLFAVTIVVVLTVGLLASAGTAAATKPRLILAPIADTSAPEGGKQKADGIAEAIRGGLKEALFKSGKFVIIADSDLQKDLDSERYNQYLSGSFNPAMAAAIGQKVGAQALVKCNVVANQWSKKVNDLILVKETEYHMELSVSVEVCDIEQAVVSFMHTSSSDQKQKSKALDLGTKDNPQTPISLSNAKDVRVIAINEVVKDLAEKIIKNAVREKGKGSVTSVKGAGKADDAIVVDIGSNAGASVDMEVSILGVDEDGFEDTIGKAKITNTQEDKSKAVIVSTKRAVVAGDMVQLAGAGSSSGGSIVKVANPSATTPGTARQRVMVVVPEVHLKLVVPDPAGETEIIKRLTESNFIVVDQQVSKDIAANDKMRETLAGNAEKVLQMIGDRTEAEIIIYGEAFSEGIQRITTDSGPAFKCGARIEVRAVQRDNARILYADGVHAIAVDATEALAGKRALKAAAGLLCGGHDGSKGFVEMVSDRLLNPVQLVECIVSGLESEDDLKLVEDGLKASCGGSLHRYSYRGGVAKFNFESNKIAQELTDAVSSGTLKGKIKLSGTTPNKIEYEFVK